MLNPIWLFRSNLPLADRESLPHKSGIYYAVDRWGRVRYVGLSNNLHRRWNAEGDRRHHKLRRLESIGHIKLYWRLVPEYRLEFEEALEIQHHKPDLNDLFPDPKNHKNWLIEVDQLTVNLVLLLLIAVVGVGIYKTAKPLDSGSKNPDRIKSIGVCFSRYPKDQDCSFFGIR